MIEVKNNKLFHEEVNTCLKRIIKNKSYANGYIFCGADGLGKKQTAFEFIKEIFKQSSVGGNIEEKITNNNHPDFLIIEPDFLLSTKNSISSDLEKTIKITNLHPLRNYCFIQLIDLNMSPKLLHPL